MQMTTRLVTLSDGTQTKVALHVHNQVQYYPDRPHCCMCDRTQGEVQLYTCDFRERGRGKHRCGRYVCAEHGEIAVSRGHDRCALHAHRSRMPEGERCDTHTVGHAGACALCTETVGRYPKKPNEV